VQIAMQAYMQQVPPPQPTQENPNPQPPAPPTIEELMLFKVDLMEKEIENHLIATKYGLECRRAMMDRIILGTGILKGPKNVGKQKKVYQKLTDSMGRTVRIPRF